ncbi:hypothetical protein [Candidatus Entotheonella palauensis]|uniref:ParD-like antitoxin of type II toxin-antitoxin system n=1 Tax=Candidatus Entotheonella gemina TaxID=1429439 RepID=W4M8E1_9BACT|nr:hypothetical protein [Candidatus Entotheonella palauensis]ETX06470.1 MAG: hypothetical protein ETSY2_16930 [Candidatus Entotheonella gemina]
MKQSSIAVRLSTALYEKADVAAKDGFRSTPKQIELWAELGYQLSKYLEPQDIVAVSLGLKRLICEVDTSEAIDSEKVVAEMGSKSKQKEVSQHIVNQHPYVFEASEVPGKLDQVFPDGTRVTGDFVNGRFVPDDRG